MRVVVLTNGSSHGAEILQALSSRNISLAAILVERSNQSRKAQLQRSIRRYGYVQTAYDIFDLLRAKITGKRATPIPYSNYSDRVHRIADFNGPECFELLTELRPDIIVLAGAPILKSPILSTAKTAVLNAHPGLLPKYRGVDVIAWAVLNGDPVGVTIHKVDSGIDTGAIVLQERFFVEPGDSLASLRRKAEMLAGQLMARAVSGVISDNCVKTIPQTKAPDPLYRRMPRAMLRKAEKRMQLR